MRLLTAALGLLATGLWISAAPVTLDAQQASANWTQWGGPNRDFSVPGAPRLADAWPATGPRQIWSRPLGPGHSTILVENGRLYTMYRAGDGRARNGPFAAEEAVVALDAATGQTIWEHKYASKRQDFSRGAGPHSTPLIVGERLFTIGTNQEFHALDKTTGKVLWSHDLVRDFGAPELLIRPVVKSGYGTSPLAYRDTIITFVGGPGQSVMAFRQDTGAVVWRSGHFLTSGASPILIDVDGQEQLVSFAGNLMVGMAPDSGRILWTHPHDAGNDFNFSLPLWDAESNILFMSSGYKAGSRAIQLTRTGDRTDATELWFNTRFRFQFLNGIRVGEWVYGTTGDLGPAFLGAIHMRTGERTWQHRGFGQATMVHADGKFIIVDEDGDLALARLTPQGAEILSEVKIFDTVAWTAPTLAGTTLYARDREKIIAFDLGAP